MSDEDRLRSDLATLAERAPLDPHGWQHVLARRSRTRTLRVAAATAAVLVVLGGVGVWLIATRDTGTRLHATAPPPSASASRQLAYVHDGRVFVQATDGKGRQVDLSGVRPTTVSLSRDGRYLAVIGDPGLVVLESASGRELARSSSPIVVSDWSPAGDALLFTTTSGELFTWRPDSEPARFGPDVFVYSARWSPDGERIAYSTHSTSPLTDQLVIAKVADARAFTVATTSDDLGYDIAGWSPDQEHLVVWLDPAHSASIAADGVDLVSYPALSEGAPIPLGRMVPDPHRITWSPDGKRFAFVSGTGRFLADRKVVTVCDSANGPCRDLEQPADVSTADVAWSPDGRRLVVTRGPAQPSDAPQVADIAAFDADRHLYWVDPTNANAHPVDGAPGEFTAREPRWTGADRLVVNTDAGLTAVGLFEGQPETLTQPVDAWDLSAS